ncbi:MAG: hypothetical protein ACPID7_06140, partial [Candidatus Puniceispirillum sp.]
MARTTLSNSAGPGSSTPLAPQTIKVRDAVIAKCDDQSLDEMNEFVKGLLERETDELKRLGILAARVYILRQRIMALMESGALNGKEKKLDFIDPAPAQPDDDIDGFADIDDSSDDTNWMRVRIIENCEVNGVRFPSGVVIDVHADDANKLIEYGKAELQAKDLHDDFSDIPDDTPDMTEEVTDASDGSTDINENLADASEGVNDTSDDIGDTADDLADTDDDVSDVSEDQPESSDENMIDDQQDENETSEVADQDNGIDDEIDNAEIDLSQGDVISDDMPDEIDLTAPLSEDISEPDDSAEPQPEDIADNEAIAAAVADKMPKASASSPDGEPVEASESELDAGLQELDDLVDLDDEADDS